MSTVQIAKSVKAETAEELARKVNEAIKDHNVVSISHSKEANGMYCALLVLTPARRPLVEG